MKSVKLLALGAALFSTVSAGNVVTVNSNRLLAESKRGLALQEDVKNRAQALQETLSTRQNELRERSEKLNKQSAALSQEAYNKELIDLRMSERQIQRDLQGQQEDLQMFAQTKQAELKSELLTFASNVQKDKGYDLVLDSSQPFVIASAKDITEEVLALANADVKTA